MRFDGTNDAEATAIQYFGVKSYGAEFSATIEVSLTGGNIEHFIKPDLLTGNCSLNAVLGEGVGDFEKVAIILTADTTQRTVTLAGNIIGSAIVVPLSTTKVVYGTIVDGKVLISE